MSLAEKRAALAERHKAQEEFDPHWKQVAADSPKEGAERRLSERPIAFIVDDEIVIVGSDVTTIRKALQEFVALTESDEWKERAAQEQVAKHAEIKVKSILERPVTDELRMHQQWWNAITLALGEVGQQVCVTEGKK